MQYSQRRGVRAYNRNGTQTLASTPSPVSERVLITEGMLVRVADRLRVLGQVVRLRLVEQLRAGQATPQELADMLGLTQQNVSKHLQVLHRSGVVTRRPDGANVFYALADESTPKLLDDVLASVTEHLRGLSALAGGLPDAQDRTATDDGTAPVRVPATLARLAPKRRTKRGSAPERHEATRARTYGAAWRRGLCTRRPRIGCGRWGITVVLVAGASEDRSQPVVADLIQWRVEQLAHGSGGRRVLAQASSEVGHRHGEAIEQFAEGHRRSAEHRGLAFDGLVDLVGVQGVEVE